MAHSSRILSICLVKNEADVLGHCLAEAQRWSDRIFVFDNGSTDGTWELVQALASDVIVPWKRDDRPYNDGIRSLVFDHFRHEARAGDWWCKLDADEFYMTDPREFLAKVPQRHHVVWGLAVNFYLTRADLDTVDFAAGFEQVRPKIRHYRADSSEARFFRHRDKLVWPTENASWPLHMGVVHPEMIPFRHYQFRSPEQMLRRLETRRDAVERGYREYSVRVSFDWKDHLADPLKCQNTDDNGSITFDKTRFASTTHRAIAPTYGESGHAWQRDVAVTGVSVNNLMPPSDTSIPLAVTAGPPEIGPETVDAVRATVVITSRNRKDELARAIESALAQTIPAEIIVVDDGSTDGTAEFVKQTRFSTVRLEVREDSRGLIVRRNEAARIARGDVLFSIDDDATFSTRHVMEQTLEDLDVDQRIAAVAIPCVDVLKSDRPRQPLPDRDGVYVTSEYIGTAHAVLRDVFLSLGGYRELLVHQGEERDFCLRLLAAGHFVRLGTADPIHHFESPKRDLSRQDFFGRRNDVLYAWQNAPWRDLPIHLVGTTWNGVAIRRAMRPTRPNAAGTIARLRGCVSIRRHTSPGGRPIVFDGATTSSEGLHETRRGRRAAFETSDRKCGGDVTALATAASRDESSIERSMRVVVAHSGKQHAYRHALRCRQPVTSNAS